MIDSYPSIDDGTLNFWSLTIKGEGATTPCLKGDMNHDGIVNIFDVVGLAKIILGSNENPTAFELCAADYDGDGEVLIFDIIKMINFIFGIDLTIEPVLVEATVVKKPETLNIKSNGQLGGIFLILETEGEVTSHDLSGAEIFIQKLDKEVAILVFSPEGLTISGDRLLSIKDEYRIKEVEISDRHGNRISSNIISVPEEYTLHQNYPNPFNSVTHIPFDLEDAGQVNLIIYNLLGQKVKTLLNKEIPIGFHEAIWDRTNDIGELVGGGIYLCHFSVNGFLYTRKIILLK